VVESDWGMTAANGQALLFVGEHSAYERHSIFAPNFA
jgi:hypothetical protein